MKIYYNKLVLFRKDLIVEWGIPNVIQTDNGKEFYGEFDKVLKENNIIHRRGRPYHPESQGSVESFNKYFKNQLIGKVLEHRENPNFKLEDAIRGVIQYYNHIKIHSTTLFTPAFLFVVNDEDTKRKAAENVRKRRL